MRTFLLLAFVLFCGPAIAQPAHLKLIIFPGGLSWPIFVAQDKGFFAREGLEVKVTETPGSVFQIKGIMAGDFDIAMTPFDNIVAYQEGQGETSFDVPPDLFVFMGGISSTLRLIVQPGIATFADLRDKTLGVDALSTGYTLLMYRLLEQNGLPPGSYKLERLGGTASRVKALTEGRIAATMVSSPQEILPEQNGFRRLGDIQSMLGRYQALSGAARRSWAASHPNQLQSFIRAYVAAGEWLTDDQNRAEAATIYARYIPNTPDALIAKAREAMLSETEGFQPRAKFDPAGAQTALAVRKQYGVPKKDLPDWRTYVDETFYDEALKAK
ncbi:MULTISPECIES: ABC transporter substrate-binding protein [unclassified Tardiphaga]|uniref:ABC transporter substrate-binding protein n=1 Tax=unclassified Tardiphaga TaxID=2631404 RepID=UPI00143CE4DA|nr:MULTISPECIES: ABC transporter substrate-binding protein [unclassified Tardiphaga]